MDGYVVIAEAERSRVRGECFNISSWRFEMLDEIARALVREYEILGGRRFGEAKEGSY